MMLDSGSVMTLVSTTSLSREDFEMYRLPGKKARELVMWSGRPQKAILLAKLHRLEMGDRAFRDFPVGITNFLPLNAGLESKIDGIIGLDLLRKWKKLTINFDERVVELD